MADEKEKQQVLDALKHNQLAAVATVTEDGHPYVVVMFYVVDDDFNFYLVTRDRTRKVLNLKANEHIALSIGLKPPMNVQVSGRAELVEDEELRGQKLTELAQAGAGLEDIWPPILHIGNNDYLLYRVVPDRIRALDLNNRRISTEDRPFIEIM